MGTEEKIVARGSDNPFGTAGNYIYHQFLPIVNAACAYELTATLPLATLNMTVGTPIGFDIKITVDDNGGKRESSNAWIGFDDRSNENPSRFGTILLK